MGEAARMVEAAGADLVDINFGCPVRKVTKTGAGATLLDDPARACAIVEAVAGAVGLPVSVKMRRGLRDGARTCLEVGPRLVDAGAATLTLHPRSAQQMYTGTADHSLTAELVSLVDVPVIASGDIVSRARAQAVLATTGASAVMVGRGAQGNPWALREIVDGDDREPPREEVAAELVLFIRETVQGARRAPGDRVPEEVLRLVSRPRPLPEGVQAGAAPARLDRGGRAPAAGRGARRLRAARTPGGRAPLRRRGDARPPDLDLRRRLARAARPCAPPRARPRSASPPTSRAAPARGRRAGRRRRCSNGRKFASLRAAGEEPVEEQHGVQDTRDEQVLHRGPVLPGREDADAEEQVRDVVQDAHLEDAEQLGARVASPRKPGRRSSS